MQTDKVILGENCICSTDCGATQLNNNIVAVGSSGSGKTMSFSEARLISTYNTSLIITQSKRRLVAKYTPMFKKRSYKVWDLNFADPQKSNIGYDPLEYVHSYSDITFLARSIVNAYPQKKNSRADPYWDDAAVSLLSAEIAYTLTTEEHPTFADVLAIHDSLDLSSGSEMITTSLDYQFSQVMQAAPKSFAAACWRSFRQLPVRTAACVYGTLNTTIDTVFTPDIRKIMAMNDKVDFKKLGSERIALFVTSSPVNNAQHCLENIFHGQALKELYEFAEGRDDGILPMPVHMLCDDFATGSTIQNFAELISIIREKRISVSLLLQSESQLGAMYGEKDATTILNNCDTYLYFGGMDLKTCRSISERLNVLDEVLYMPLGQQIIFRRGHKPLVTQRYNILENEVYKRITRKHQRTESGEATELGL